jgi:hypothetical protein
MGSCLVRSIGITTQNGKVRGPRGETEEGNEIGGMSGMETRGKGDGRNDEARERLKANIPLPRVQRSVQGSWRNWTS